VHRAVIVCVLSAGLVACAGDDDVPGDTPPSSAVEMLDTDGLEQELKQQIESQTGTKMRTVDCPTVELEAGASFDCVAEDRSDTTYTIVVTQRDDQGNVDWEVTEGM
jgi:Domain of unknown function (DUF4333)